MKSVYIHIPFCNTICTYCDFCKFYYNQKWVTQYLESLEEEIKENYKQEKIKTLYIGGGTPTSLSIDELKQLFEILKLFHLEYCEEFTFECNIENLTKEKALFLYQNKVNRLSIGIETFHDKHLKKINRHHSKEQVFETINMLKEIGFTNINVDFIYALPGETIEEVKEDINFFLKLNIPHISTYSLVIEENTILKVKNTEPLPEEIDAQMYQEIKDTLKKHGYYHYEVSNFSKIGYESKHNLVYWNNQEYYGFGVGASGYINHIRYDNTRNIQKYMNQEYVKEKYELTKQEEMENEFILGLRKTEGVSKIEFERRYQINPSNIKIINRLLKHKYLLENEQYIYIPEEKFYVSNGILCELIGCEEDEWNIINQ